GALGGAATPELGRSARKAALDEKMKEEGTVAHKKAVNHCSFSPDGRYFVTASSDGTARVWDAVTAKPATPALNHGGRVIQTAFSADGRWVLTASQDQTVRLWDLYLPAVSDPTPREGRGVQFSAFSPDGRRLVMINGDGTVWICETDTNKRVALALESGTWVSNAWILGPARLSCSCRS